MGVRLFPEGLGPEQMEELAKVPKGTWDRLMAHEATCPKGWDQESMNAEDRWYEVLEHDPQMTAMHHLKIFGFGKLTNKAFDILRAMGVDENCGHTSEYGRVQALLLAQGIQSDVIKTVSWS